MRVGVILLSCLVLATFASAQVAIVDAPAAPAALAPDSFVVTGDAESCLTASTLSLAGISERGSSIEIASRRTDACRWVVRGLDSGAYEIGLTHARGSGGRIRFAYVRGQTTTVRIPASRVRVTGVVRINGEPVPDAQIMFTASQRGPRPERVMINVWYESGLQGWAALRFPAGRELRGAPFGTHRVAIKRGSGPEETITSVTISADAPRGEAVIDVP